jgi:hypothetical protein
MYLVIYSDLWLYNFDFCKIRWNEGVSCLLGTHRRWLNARWNLSQKDKLREEKLKKISTTTTTN